MKGAVINIRYELWLDISAINAMDLEMLHVHRLCMRRNRCKTKIFEVYAYFYLFHENCSLKY